MKKIKTMFVRDQSTKLVTPAVTPGCEWVIAGEGTASRKLDGTACLIRGGKLFKRYEAKYKFAKASDPEEGRVGVRDGKSEGFLPIKLPAGFEAETDIDPVTGKQQGWVPVGDGPEDRWHRQALVATEAMLGGAVPLPDGTYELLGPKIQGNPEKADCHYLERHGAEELVGVPRDFDGLKAWLAAHDVEGIVWHRDNGDMVKLKAKDFGIKRGGVK